jgi:hypothetical protein
MRHVASNELGTFSLHVKLQVCFESEASLGCAVGAHGKDRLPVPFLPILPMRQKIVAHFGVTVCRKSLKNEPLGKIDMKILKVAVALGLATSLSGCLSDDNTDVDVVSMARTLLTEVDADGVASLAFADIDPSSTATMTGVIGARFSESGPVGDGTDVGFAGEMSMVANFTDSTVTGSTSNLGVYEYSSGCLELGECEDTTKLSSLDGDLTLTNGLIVDNDGDAGFEGELQGLVNGDFPLGDEDYAFSAAVLLDIVEGQFGEDEDGRLFAAAGLDGDTTFFYQDEAGIVAQIDVPLEGYMIFAE